MRTMSKRQGYRQPRIADSANNASLPPALYHAHHSLESDDLDFWDGLATRQAGRILELGCGTGRVLLHLRRKGHNVLGLDIDPLMLAYLSTHHCSQEPAPVFQADLAAFHLAARFSLILLPCNTWSTLSPDVRSAALETIRHHLASTGLFVVSLPNPLLLSSLPLRSEPAVEGFFPHPQDGEPVQVSSGWRRDSRSVTFHWYYDHLSSDGMVERWVAQVRHSLDTADTYQEELRRAGFSIQALYGDYDASPYTPDATQLIFLAGAASA